MARGNTLPFHGTLRRLIYLKEIHLHFPLPNSFRLAQEKGLALIKNRGIFVCPILFSYGKGNALRLILESQIGKLTPGLTILRQVATLADPSCLYLIL